MVVKRNNEMRNNDREERLRQREKKKAKVVDKRKYGNTEHTNDDARFFDGML